MGGSTSPNPSLQRRGGKRRTPSFDIAVFHFPRISNFTDFKPLELEEGVNVRYFRKAGELGNPDLVILPGTKSTVADARFLIRNGIGRVLKNYVGSGGRLLGICGGMQLLGEEIEDDSAGASNGDKVRGLGFFPLKTHLLKRKVTYQVQARPAVPELSLEGPVGGYEIHMGKTVAKKPVEPFMLIERRGNVSVQLHDGVVDQDRRVFGTYIHGLFENDRFRETFLRFLKPGFRPASKSNVHFRRDKERQYEKLARVVEQNLDLKSIFRWLR
jgi:adenosylcobyric acid synthase